MASPREPRRNRPTTIVDVAKEAGVSRQTVTRALNNMPDVSAATAERVIAAATLLNYRPNRAAQGLVGGHSIVIGFVVEDLTNPFYPELASALSGLAAGRDWNVMLCDLAPPNHGHGDVRATLHSLAQRADALIGYFPEDVWSGDQLARRIPSVVLDADHLNPEAASVSINVGPGVEAALDHFVGSGRTRIGMIDCFPHPSPRRLYYRSYLERKGLAWTPQSEAWAETTHLGGIAAAAQLHQQYPEMDALLVFNDVMAVGALKSLAHAGVRVPADCAVIGVDGLEIGQLVTPELSTLEIDRGEMARHALDLVDGMLSGALPLHGPLVQRTMTHTLVLRESA